MLHHLQRPGILSKVRDKHTFLNLGSLGLTVALYMSFSIISREVTEVTAKSNAWRGDRLVGSFAGT